MKSSLTLILMLFSLTTLFSQNVCTVKIVSVNTSNSFSYTFKTDPVNTSSKYYWTFGDNTIADSPMPTHIFSKAGSYLIKVKVTATDGKICYGELNAQFEGGIVITPVVPCTVHIVSTKNSATPAGYIFKTDPINTSSKYFWTFGDNTVADSHAPTHTYSKAGAYLVKVKVTATDGKICYGELNAQFEGGVVPPPVVTLTGKGKVKKTTSTEGCGLLITMENGSVLVPVEMVSPFEFKDGQYVELAYQLLKDKPSGCPAGVAAKITRIAVITPATVCTVKVVSTKNSTTPASYTFKTDPINTSSKYYWTFGDNTVSDSHAPTHTYSKAGSYLVKVKVTATDGKICYGELNAQFDGGVVTPPVVTLTGKGKVKKTTSTEGCGLLITMVNGSVLVPSVMVPAFEFKDGQYVELAYQLLKDKPSGCPAGVAAKITRIAVITPATVCTVKVVSTKNSTTPASYTFKTDPINTSSRYYWTFGDNTVSDSHAPTHTYSKAGAYLVKVKVTATDGKICYGELNAQFDGGVVTPPVVTLTGKGKVTNLSSATGCGLVITTDAGIRLIPATIKTDFVLKEGQNVEFTYEKYAEKVTSCKEGSDIKIITIKEIVATTLPSCKGPINLTLYDPTDNKCNGGAKVKLLDENGKEMTNVKYIWSDGRSGSSVESLCPEKLYTVQAIVEHVCQKYTSFALLSKPIWQTKTTNGQNNFTVLAPVDGVKYEWNFGNGISKTGAAVTYNFQKDGIYDVQLKAVSLNGTSEYTQKVLVLKSIATTDIIRKPELEIYPNPVKEVLKIDLKNLPKGDLTAEIRNIAGHSLFIQQINNDGSSYAEINVQSIKAGLYVLRVTNGQHLVSERKFLKAN